MTSVFPSQVTQLGQIWRRKIEGRRKIFQREWILNSVDEVFTQLSTGRYPNTCSKGWIIDPPAPLVQSLLKARPEELMALGVWAQFSTTNPYFFFFIFS